MAVPDIALSTARALADFAVNEAQPPAQRMAMPADYMQAKL
jgi:hypothetical protein